MGAIEVEVTMSTTQTELAVKFLKHRLRSDHATFRGNSAEYDQIRDLVSRTSENGESNSALVIGTAGCGKTTVCKLSCVILAKSKPNDPFPIADVDGDIDIGRFVSETGVPLEYAHRQAQRIRARRRCARIEIHHQANALGNGR